MEITQLLLTASYPQDYISRSYCEGCKGQGSRISQFYS